MKPRKNRFLISFVIPIISIFPKYSFSINTSVDTAEIKYSLFLPEIFVSRQEYLHGFPTFSSDQTQIYWPVIPPKILTSRKINDSWTEPTNTSFSKGNIQAVFYSQKQNQIYFQKYDKKGYGSLDIFYIEQDDLTWSDAVNLGSPPNSIEIESQPSLTNSGTLYFTGQLEGSGLDRGIYRSELINDQYQKPQLLPEQINSEFIDYTPFIDPEENYLLFASSRPYLVEDSLRLYISFRQKDNRWTTPTCLNTIIGFNHSSRFPCLTPNNKWIVFLSRNKYWKVTNNIIEIAKKKNFSKNSRH